MSGRWVTYAELGRWLAREGLPASPRTLRRWVKRHRIPVVRVNHRVVRIHGPSANRVIRSLLSPGGGKSDADALARRPSVRPLPRPKVRTGGV